MNGMQSKAGRRRWAAQWTENGLPRDTRDWTVADWKSLWDAMTKAAKEIAARHKAESRKGNGQS